MLAHGFPRIIGSIDDAQLGARIALQVCPIPIGAIGMTTGAAYGTARRVDARPWHHALVDRIAQGNRGIVAITQVAHGGETGFQGASRVHGGADRVIGHVPAELIGVSGRTGFAGQVHMAVDQAGQAGHALEVDRAGSAPGRVAVARRHCLDAAILDHQGHLAGELAALGIEYLIAMQDGGFRGYGSHGQCKRKQDSGAQTLHFHGGFLDQDWNSPEL
jgi:hypothetical protein